MVKYKRSKNNDRVDFNNIEVYIFSALRIFFFNDVPRRRNAQSYIFSFDVYDFREVEDEPQS